MDCKCATCLAREKFRFGFFKPKGWKKIKAPDGNVLYFCSEKCLKKFKGEL